MTIPAVRVLGALVTAVLGVPAQDLLLYKFDDDCRSSVVNFALGSPAPNEGSLVVSSGAPLIVNGRFGGGMFGSDPSLVPGFYQYVDTGWNPGTVTGSLTWAAWLRITPGTPTPTSTDLFGTGSSSGFGVFSGSGGFLLTKNWGGPIVATQADVHAMARSGWVHVALVIDGAAGTATYHIDGVAEPAISVGAAVSWSGSSFYVGRNGSMFGPTAAPASPNVFIVDEFFLANRAVSTIEIQALATGPRAGVGRFGSGGCGNLTIATSGGRPSVGNPQLALTIDSAYMASFVIGIGTDRCDIGGVPLPLDLGTIAPQWAGCALEIDPNLSNLTANKAAGTLTVPIPVPNVLGLAGTNLFVQVPGFDPSTSSLVLSNALVLSVGS